MSQQYDLVEVEAKTVEWANARNIILGASPDKQTLKLGSEFGELCDNIGKGRYESAKDDLGDCFILLVILAQQIGSTLEECANVAYNDIKDRKGKMVNGMFVKEADLKKGE